MGYNKAMPLLKISLCLVIFLALAKVNLASAENFPVKGTVKTRVHFWKKVYTEITSLEGFLHDPKDLSIIYKKLSLPEESKARKEFIKQEKEKIKQILHAIIDQNTQNFSEEENKILEQVTQKSKSELQAMAQDIRLQYGLKDRYYEGLIRSYKYMDFILKTYQEMGLPLELAYLPHVESSFNYEAYSKVGAAGIWQFMRSTGRLYGLKENYLIDERRDPIKATKAAARLLRDNFIKLNSWPLALTAYNHGAQSMAQAIASLGTTDIDVIIDQYQGKRFGFASKNFYATFMATVEISKNPEKYFPSFKPPASLTYSTITLDQPYRLSEIQAALKLETATIKEYNYQIRPIAYRNDAKLPAGHELRLPKVADQDLVNLKNNLRLLSTAKIAVINTVKKTPAKKPLPESKIVKEEPKKIQTADIIGQIAKDLYLPEWYKPIVEQKEMPLLLAETAKPLKSSGLQTYSLEVKQLNANLYQIIVEPDETLGHYADWGLLRVDAIRSANRYGSGGSVISQGKSLNLPLNEQKLERFIKQREEFHLSLQEDFFNNYAVHETEQYVIKKGDQLGQILASRQVPFWLFRVYQTNFNPNASLKIGDIIEIPIITKLKPESVQFPQDENTDEDN
jgi:flagellar basal body-associated protein FliL